MTRPGDRTPTTEPLGALPEAEVTWHSELPPFVVTPADFAEENERRRLSGSKLAYAASGIHIVSMVAANLLIVLLLDSALPSPHTGSQLMEALLETRLAGYMVAGTIMQIVFASLAALGGHLLRRRPLATTIPFITLGTVAAILSVSLFGGIIGAIGGILTVVAGAWARPRTWKSRSGE